MRMTVRQGAFTLVELVVVITILGILAAFAIPRFASLETDARSAETTALGGRVRSSAALAHAFWLAQGQPATVEMEGSEVTLSNGYPNEATIAGTLESIDGFVYDSTTGVFSKTDNGSTAISNCAVTYAAPKAVGAAPSITVDVTGC